MKKDAVLNAKLTALGLSPAEAEVAALVARGMSNV